MTYFHPQRMPALSARRREAARLQLEQAVSRSVTSGRKVKPMAVAAGVALIVLSTGAAAYAVVAYQPVASKTVARCYTAADERGSFATIPTAAAAGTQAEARSALSLCTALFRQGWLRLGAAKVTRPPAGNANYPVPRLTVCTLPDQVAAVFPGGAATCAKLGAQPGSSQHG